MNADITMPDNSINATFKLEIVPDISDLATKAEVAAVEAQIPDVLGFATKTELSAVENQIPDISGLATKSEVSAVESEIPDVSGLATKTELSAVEAQIPAVPTNVSAFTNDSNYVTSTVLSQNLPVSNALETGVVSANSAVYTEFLSRLHSSFDLSKFTVTGSPTITDNGIASGVGLDNYIETGIITAPSAQLEINAKGIYYSGSNTLWSRTGTSTNFACGILNANSIRIYNAGDNSSFTQFIGGALSDGDYVEVYLKITATTRVLTVTSKYGTYTTSETGVYTIPQFTKYTVGSNNAGTYAWLGTTDLKHFWIKSDDILVFSGNKTGMDSYTIGGNTVTVPYEVTKGGAKIAAAAYRTAIQSVYAENGFAPYYTIDETSQNFTLPMGDLYGMLQKLSDRISALET